MTKQCNCGSAGCGRFANPNTIPVGVTNAPVGQCQWLPGIAAPAAHIPMGQIVFNNYPQQGWQCPVCRNVWAPFISKCQKCPDGQFTYGPSSGGTGPSTLGGQAVGSPNLTTEELKG